MQFRPARSLRRSLRHALVLAAALAVSSTAAEARVDYAFTVVAPRSVSPSQLVARVVVERPGARCPVVRARSSRGLLRVPMKRVPRPQESVGFDGITVCRAALPSGLRRASVEGRRLPLLPRGTPARIALFGDTGCRIAEFPPTPPSTEPGYEVQDCNSRSAWPFETIAGEIAAARPQIAVSTGDYFYREADCPASGPLAPLCAGSPPVNPPGSPNEDTWAGWEADWFRPARALFPVAPLVLPRGNHESCSRGGTGYFYLLEPGVSPPDTCQRAYAAVYEPDNPPPSIAQPTWSARLGSIDVVVLDSSSADDSQVSSPEVYAALGRRAVSLLRPRATGWLVTHRPVYGWERFAGPGTPPVWTNVTLQAALDGLIAPFAAIISGHLHLFQTVELPDRPAQLVIGDGGTLLDDSGHGGDPPTFGPSPVAGGPSLPAPTRGITTFTFGWTLLRPSGRGVFTGARYEVGKGPWARCRLAFHSVDCSPS